MKNNRLGLVCLLSTMTNKKGFAGITSAKKSNNVHEIFRFAPFYFSKKYEVKKVNPLLRLSIVLVYVLLIVGRFFNFLIFGKWQYEFKYVKWLNKIGL